MKDLNHVKKVSACFLMLHIMAMAIRIRSGYWDSMNEALLLLNSAFLILIVFRLVQSGREALGKMALIASFNLSIYASVITNYMVFNIKGVSFSGNSALIILSLIVVLAAGYLGGRRWVAAVAIPSAAITLIVFSGVQQAPLGGIIFYIFASGIIYIVHLTNELIKATRETESGLHPADNIVSGKIIRFRKRKSCYSLRIETAQGEKRVRVSLSDFEKLAPNLGDQIVAQYVDGDNSAITDLKLCEI